MIAAIRQLALALALTGLTALLAIAARAAEATPDRPVKDAYAITIKTLAASGQPPWRPPHRDRLLSKSLAALFAVIRPGIPGFVSRSAHLDILGNSSTSPENPGAKP